MPSETRSRTPASTGTDGRLGRLLAVQATASASASRSTRNFIGKPPLVACAHRTLWRPARACAPDPADGWLLFPLERYFVVIFGAVDTVDGRRPGCSAVRPGWGQAVWSRLRGLGEVHSRRSASRSSAVVHDRVHQMSTGSAPRVTGFSAGPWTASPCICHGASSPSIPLEYVHSAVPRRRPQGVDSRGVYRVGYEVCLIRLVSSAIWLYSDRRSAISSRHRYMATWRALTRTRDLECPRRSSRLTPK